MNSYSEWFFGRSSAKREPFSAPPVADRAVPARSAQPAAQAAAQAGFTLLEILIVLVILGLVAAVVAGPQVFKYLGTAKSEAAKVQLERVAGALDLYRLEVGRYPSQQENLGALVDPPPGLPNWNGPYLKKREAIIDPWGRPLSYRIPGQYGEYDLYTLGADNAVGGEGENRDITNY